MKIENMKKVGDEMLTFTLKDSTPAFANALRRTMMAEIPVMAILFKFLLRPELNCGP